ncbi:hypothetical protein CLIM01_07692 [Colletotrichum limetticola]|uniref:Uncharacterized protein n=1 Tax=Colletotrichum limetticola TaxID=1209924 RepID=A0ABQ9PTS9_9PEZI|nr:hypothetical protein CLIM01_07692 [Colletotrichum limetticola]
MHIYHFFSVNFLPILLDATPLFRSFPSTLDSAKDPKTNRFKDPKPVELGGRNLWGLFIGSGSSKKFPPRPQPISWRDIDSTVACEMQAKL